MNIEAVTDTRSLLSSGIRSFLHSLASQPSQLAMALEHWRRRQQACMQFANIDAHTLRDVGISEARRFLEINEPS